MIRGILKGIGRLISFTIRLGITIILIAACIFVDARYIEPKLMITKEEKLSTNKLVSASQLKIVQFSDTHLGDYYLLSDLDKLVSKINALNPDLIIFTGDLVDNNEEYDDEEGVTKVLSKLQCKYGKFAVIGNHDHGGNGTKRYTRIMKNSGFNLLVNDYETITLDDGSKVSLIGIDDIVLGKPQLNETFSKVPEENYKLFLSHAPDVAEKAAAYDVDLQLSGHTHGGQVRIPFIGAPFTPPYGKQYIKGFYEVGNSKMALYVNAGIGVSQLPFRFLNPPELTIITIYNPGSK